MTAVAFALAKTCSACDLEKPIAEFYRDAKSRDGRSSSCKSCRRANARAWNLDHPERHAANRAASYQRNRAAYTVDNAAKLADCAARRSPLGWDAVVDLFAPRAVFERDDWTCHLCGRRVAWDVPMEHPGKASVDHLRPLVAGGLHALGNVATACLPCNRLRELTDLSGILDREAIGV